MDFSANYTQIQDDSTVTRNGGLIIKGKARTERQPVHMILLVDSSGSMEENNKMSSVKRSIQLLQVLLCSNDRLSVVSFADDSKVIVSRASATPEERAAIQYRVDSISPNGSTNLSAGLLEVRSLVEGLDSGRKQGVLILTDGHANAGVMTAKGLVEIVSRIQTESPGLSVTTVAYGDDHNTEVLTEIAKAGGGAYNLVRNLEDVATVFGDSRWARQCECTEGRGSAATWGCGKYSVSHHSGCWCDNSLCGRPLLRGRGDYSLLVSTVIRTDSYQGHQHGDS